MSTPTVVNPYLTARLPHGRTFVQAVVDRFLGKLTAHWAPYGLIPIMRLMGPPASQREILPTMVLRLWVAGPCLPSHNEAGFLQFHHHYALLDHEQTVIEALLQDAFGAEVICEPFHVYTDHPAPVTLMLPLPPTKYSQLYRRGGDLRRQLVDVGGQGKAILWSSLYEDGGIFRIRHSDGERLFISYKPNEHGNWPILAGTLPVANKEPLKEHLRHQVLFREVPKRRATRVTAISPIRLFQRAEKSLLVQHPSA